MTLFHCLLFKRFISNTAIVLLFSCIALLQINVRAEELSVSSEEPQVIEPILPKQGVLSLLDKSNEKISSGLTSFSNRVDNYFSNEKDYYAATGSFIRITADMVWNEEDNDVGFQGDVRLKLNLPRTKKKLKFILETDSEQDRSDVDQVLKDTPLDAADNESYYAGLQFVSGEKTQWRFRRTLGVKVRAPPDYFVRLRANKKYQFDAWRLRLDEGLFWFDSTGVGVDSSIEFDRALADELLFRSRSYARWDDEDKNTNISQVFSIFKSLGQRELLAYQAGVYAETKPSTQITDYLVAVRYRRNIHEDYLFVEFVPQVLFSLERDFHPEHSILFRFEWLFTG